VLLSTHVVEAEDALGHKHNSLVATTAQSVLCNSLKIDETAFHRSESERTRRIDEIRAAVASYQAEREKKKHTEI